VFKFARMAIDSGADIVFGQGPHVTRAIELYKDKFISVYAGDERIIHKKKKILAPGEMEEVLLEKAKLKAIDGLSGIIVCLEED